MNERLTLQLAKLQQEYDRVNNEFAKINAARSAGRINDAEYRYLLEHEYGGLNQEQTMTRLAMRIAAHEEEGQRALLDKFPKAQSHLPASASHEVTPSAPPRTRITERATTANAMARATTNDERHPVRVAVLLLIILGLVGSLVAINAYLDQPLFSVTGFVAQHVEKQIDFPVDDVYGNNESFVVTVTNTTGIRATGTLLGDGAAWIRARVNGQEYLLTYVEAQADELQYVVVTDKAEYVKGETVTATVAPDLTDTDEVTYYAYVGEQVIPLVGDSFEPSKTGEYRLDAIITAGEAITKASTTFVVVANEHQLGDETNETIETNETVDVNGTVDVNSTIAVNSTVEENATDTNATQEESTPVVVPVIPPRETEFTAACTETCVLNEYSGDVEITVEVTEGSVDLDSLQLTIVTENSPPVQVMDIPAIELEDGIATIDLAPYFNDEDGDSLTYEINNMVGVAEEINGSVLTLTSEAGGEYEAYVYVSDLHALTTSNTFTVVVPGVETNDTTVNATRPDTTNETTVPETAVNETTNETTRAPPGLCSHPDPNKRPASCFDDVVDQAFTDVVAPLKSKNQDLVGRFTRFGNLVIKGIVIENSNAVPDSGDFTIGYTQRDGFNDQWIATAWVNNGDLHLKGRLYEEQGELVPPQYDTYIVQNKYGIVLAYFDQKAGDLYLRGNIVQYGELK